MALGNIATTKDSIVFQSGRGGNLLDVYQLASVNAGFASGAVTNRNYNLGTTTTTAVVPFVVPKDTWVTSILAFVQNQTADTSRFDVHYEEPASGQYTIFTGDLYTNKPVVKGAVDIASGSFATSTSIERNEWLQGTPIRVYADEQGANASGAVVWAIGRTVRDAAGF